MKSPSAERSEVEETMSANPFTPEQRAELADWLTYYPYPIMGLLEAMRSVQLWHRCIRPEDEAALAELFKQAAAASSGR